MPCRMTGNIRSVSIVWVLLLCSRLISVGTAPTCTSARAGCHILSLASLFDRVIQHSARMHGISNDLHSEFEQYFLPSKNQIGRVSRNCHTSTILTPNGKENAQRMAREELTEVILKLLLAWKDPLWNFHQSMAHHHDFNNFSSNKALEMSDMVHELRKGVEKVAEKMQMLGIVSNSVSSLASPGASLPSDSAEWRLMKDYNLLYCFRRDSNKVHICDFLTPEQKQHCVEVCEELRQRARDESKFMSRIIISDESCIYGYDSETKDQSLQ